MIFCWPKFGERWFGPGAGLGNRLFPWARCRLFAHHHGAKMISPLWVRPAIGQIFRGGVDPHSYLRQLVLWGLFHRREGDLGLLSGINRMRGLPIIPEPEDPSYFTVPTDTQDDIVVMFQGLKGYFRPLRGQSDFLKNELLKIARPRYVSLANSFSTIPVGMCIRCGNDFDPPPVNRDVLRPGEKTPVKWFKQCLEKIREAVGYPVAAYIVSDGTREQLRELLALDNVSLVRPGSAISDLLVIARSQVLLASGSSSFAAWAAFLGQMPAASHPGQSMQAEFALVPERGQYLAELDPAGSDQEFIRQAVRKLALDTTSSRDQRVVSQPRHI